MTDQANSHGPEVSKGRGFTKYWLSALLVIVGAAVIVVLTRPHFGSSPSADARAQHGLLSLTNNVVEAAGGSNTHSFGEVARTQFDVVGASMVVDGNAASPYTASQPGKFISLQLCSDGDPCREAIVASQGAKGTCWFERAVIGNYSGGQSVSYAVAKMPVASDGECTASAAPSDGWTAASASAVAHDQWP